MMQPALQAATKRAQGKGSGGSAEAGTPTPGTPSGSKADLAAGAADRDSAAQGGPAAASQGLDSRTSGGLQGAGSGAGAGTGGSGGGSRAGSSADLAASSAAEQLNKALEFEARCKHSSTQEQRMLRE